MILFDSSVGTCRLHPAGLPGRAQQQARQRQWQRQQPFGSAFRLHHRPEASPWPPARAVVSNIDLLPATTSASLGSTLNLIHTCKSTTYYVLVSCCFARVGTLPAPASAQPLFQYFLVPLQLQSFLHIVNHCIFCSAPQPTWQLPCDLSGLHWHRGLSRALHLQSICWA